MVVIFLTKQRHRTFRFRFINIHDVGFDTVVTTNFLVH
ncbi:Uncharacterised protein [Vibrio cholerae]|nr:Uncharacterised protein [Vibrio cholerae]